MSSPTNQNKQTDYSSKSKNNLVFDLTLFSLIVILLFSLTYSLRFSNRSYGSVSQANLLDTLSFYTLKEPVTVLIAGADQEYEFADDGYAYKVPNNFRGRTDTIILAKFDPVAKKISALNIPRDTKIYINGKRPDKINSINTIGGPELLQKILEDLLNVPIDKYVLVSSEGVEKLIDEAGGIQVNVERKMVYRDKTDGLDINLEPGEQTLNGKQAIGFLRFRKDNWGDIGRIQRQQIFIRAVKKKMSDPYILTKIPTLTSMALENVLTNLSVSEMLKLANFVRTLPQEAHVFATLPGTFSLPEVETQMVYGDELPAGAIVEEDNSSAQNPLDEVDSESQQNIPEELYKVDEETGELIAPKIVKVQKPFISYWLPNQQETKKVVERLFGESDDTVAHEINPRRISIAIENTTSNKQNAYKLSSKLQNNGFRVIDITHSRKVLPSVIYAQKGNLDEAHFIQQKLQLDDDSAQVLAGSMGPPIADVTIVLGEKLATNLNSESN